MMDWDRMMSYVASINELSELFLYDVFAMFFHEQWWDSWRTKELVMGDAPHTGLKSCDSSKSTLNKILCTI